MSLTTPLFLCKHSPNYLENESAGILLFCVVCFYLHFLVGRFKSERCYLFSLEKQHQSILKQRLVENDVLTKWKKTKLSAPKMVKSNLANELLLLNQQTKHQQKAQIKLLCSNQLHSLAKI